MSQSSLGLRHWADQNDNLRRYGWLQHDGRTFGVQEIADRDISLETSFIKRPGGANGGDWTARITVDYDEEVATKRKGKKKNSTVSLFFYFALDEGASGELRSEPDGSNGHKIKGLSGKTEALGRFKVSFVDKGNAKQYFHTETVT